MPCVVQTFVWSDTFKEVVIKKTFASVVIIWFFSSKNVAVVFRLGRKIEVISCGLTDWMN